MPSNKYGYIDQFITDTTTGKFIAQLKFCRGENNHVVGIDCDEGLIYDCYEQYALKLNRNYLGVCGGYDGATILKIPFCFELKPRQKKHKKKKKPKAFKTVGVKDP